MVPAGHPEGYLDAFRNMIAQSWRAMQGEVNDFPSFHAGLVGIEVVEAAIRSVAQGRVETTQCSSDFFARAYQ